MESKIFSSQPYKGTRDFYPELLKKRNYIFGVWRETLLKNGFLEYETSVIENAEIYLAKSGQELGSKQLYNFRDKGNRFIALRPEQTPSLARIVANKFGELKFPLRWFSIPNCFRYERPQKGRLREHWQLNVDVLGLNRGEIELEILFLLGQIFKSFKADRNHFKIMFNHRKVLDIWLEKNSLAEQKDLLYSVLDNWHKLPLEENKAILAEGLDIDKVNLFVDLCQKKNQAWQDYLDIANTFDEIKLILEKITSLQPDLEYEFNPTIIRGIAYYTGIVFEAFDKNPTNPRSLFGGGRYDNLMELFGKDCSAIGFGWGDVTMHEFLENWGLYPNFDKQNQRVGVIIQSPDSLEKVFTEIIPKLSLEGVPYELNYEYERSENKRFQALNKRGCDKIMKV